MGNDIKKLLQDIPQLVGLDEDCGRCDEDIEIRLPEKLPRMSRF